jgi:acyl-CoA dehydrogenase
VFARLADSQTDFAQVWAEIETAGFPLLLVSEADGGFGGGWQDALAVMRLAGYHALAAPLAEVILSHQALAQARLPAPEGLISLAASCEGKLRQGRFTGTLKSAAYGRYAGALVCQIDGHLLLLETSHASEMRTFENPAGEPRDTLRFEAAPAKSAPSGASLFTLGALARTAMIAGALDAALERSIQYANERVQFAKPIGKFQAVQQNLAVFAEEAAAVNCAAQAAAIAAERGGAEFEIACAKLRANMAASIGAATAHQVHGAIGFTQECGLHRLTCRLVAWASEFGSQAYWEKRVGAHAVAVGAEAAAGGADALWPELVRRSDAK